MPPPAPANQPPTQAGKFKPRKPAKKILVGGSRETETTPPIITASKTNNNAADTAKRPMAVGSMSGNGTRNSRSHSSAPHSRGSGRRHFTPLQQGPSFFTAQPATVPSSNKLLRQKKYNNESIAHEEEIVGTIGGTDNSSILPDSVSSSSKPTSNRLQGDKSATAGSSSRDNWDGSTSHTHSAVYVAEGYFSDSDSSQDCDNQVLLTEHDDLMSRPQQPLAPTFAIPHQPSPDNLFSTNESLFLMQFPTRLPPVVPPTPKQTESNADRIGTDDNHNNHDDKDVEFLKSVTQRTVATPPCDRTTFDDVFTVPGRVGKLQILKNGRMRLLLEDGRGTVLNLSQGMNCRFRQEVVRIRSTQYEIIGHIQPTTLVATPDVVNAFAEK